ncbi:MAG: DUF1186 domain-containing protein [Geoalkalibacter sp.]|uniref:DUF1186 domain-containing protein n=1 Tax=Geoalkalibacter sp. TaxID=3041440 RepID=UPI003D106C8A
MNLRPIEELIEELDSYTGFTKYALMDESVERREEITPHLLAILERILADPQAWLDEDHDITCYALILLAHFEETRAHRLALELCRLPEGLPDTLFGEFLGETMPAVLYKTSGGQLDGVRALILFRQADEFVRWNAAIALTYAVADGVLAHDEVVAFFAELLGRREAAEPDSIFWTGVLEALFSLHPGAAMNEIRQGFEDGLFEEDFTSLEEVESRAAADPEAHLAGLRQEFAWRTPENIHDYMRWWDEPGKRMLKAQAKEKGRDSSSKKISRERKKNKQAKKSRRKNRKK